MKPYTVIGRYPEGQTVVVHVEAEKAAEARGNAVRRIAFQVYDDKIPDGMAPMNDAIGAVSKDFSLVAVFAGHLLPDESALLPDGSTRQYILHI